MRALWQRWCWRLDVYLLLLYSYGNITEELGKVDEAGI